MFRSALLTTVASLAAAVLGPAALATTPGASSAMVDLIPRETLFGDPHRASVELSPDGTMLSWLSPLDGVLNVWVAPVDDPSAARALTRDDDRGIRQYLWMPSATHVVYLQDTAGDENFRAYSVEVETGEQIELTPDGPVRATIVHTSREFPDTILLGVNDRDPALHDVHRVDVTTGERTLLYENPGYVGFIVDDAFDVRLGMRMEQDGSVVYRTIHGEAGDERDADDEDVFLTVPFEDSQTTALLGFDRKGETLFWIDSRQGDTAAFYTTEVRTGETTKVFEDPRADTSSAMIDPVTSEIEAVASTYLRTEWTVLDDEMEKDLARLRDVHEGEISVTSRTLDDDRWIVAYADDDGPTRYVLYDRPAGEVTDLFTNRPELEGLPLSEMHPVEITARDGLVLPSYLSLPVWTDGDRDGRPSEAVPLVLWVHGGPWARDTWGYHPYHQWLANRGYAVLSVNFRSSTGFGKSFLNAGNQAWADAMHTDLLDAVRWAIDEGIADPDRVAIAGGSYGGYAALAGLTFSPEVFAAGVSIVGPSNLITLLESIPPYWEPMVAMFTERVGDHRTPAGRRALRDMSPLTHVEEIVRPLLIGQGANDPRVKQRESDQIVDAMKRRELPVTYVLFPDEGHGFAKPENRIAFNAVMEVFLAEHLGGRAEPVASAVNESSAEVLSLGGLDLPGIEVPEWSYDDRATAAEGPGIPDVAYEDLDEQQRMIVDQAKPQLEQITTEMLPQVIAQLEAQMGSLPEAQRPAFQHLYHELKRRLVYDGG